MAIPKQGPVIAVDGPAGTGKSSVTKRIAEALGFVHVDTGAIYRATALLALELQEKELLGSGGSGGAGVSAAAEGAPVAEPRQDVAGKIAHESHFEFRRDPKKNPSNRVLINGRDVTGKIRTPEVSMAASKVATYPEVRAALLGLQRRLGCQGWSILEGRDIGTVIFPDADVKFFLTASVDERAKRRLTELETSGADAPSFEDLKRQISERDLQDSTRTVAPLKRAPGAIEIDTTTLTLDEVVAKMVATIREKLGAQAVPTRK